MQLMRHGMQKSKEPQLLADSFVKQRRRPMCGSAILKQCCDKMVRVHALTDKLIQFANGSATYAEEPSPRRRRWEPTRPKFTITATSSGTLRWMDNAQHVLVTSITDRDLYATGELRHHALPRLELVFRRGPMKLLKFWSRKMRRILQT